MPLLYLLLGIVRKLDRLKLDRKLDWKGGLYEPKENDRLEMSLSIIRKITIKSGCPCTSLYLEAEALRTSKYTLPYCNIFNTFPTRV